jgi:hypothetical protein
MRPQYRGQSYQTFQLLLNALQPATEGLPRPSAVGTAQAVPGCPSGVPHTP